MKRTIIKIDEDLCNGCGNCIPNCHEGALQIVDGKARIISDLFCDGLGACIGHCPEGAISLEEREAEPYDETKVMEVMVVPKGRNTILAHLEHLRDHNETELLKQAIAYIKDNNIDMAPKEGDHNFKPARQQVEAFASIEAARASVAAPKSSGCGGGCPGSAPIDFNIDMSKVEEAVNEAKNETVQAAGMSIDAPSELRQWPVQLHLLNPQAGYFKNADVLLAADCVAFAMGNFHDKYLKGKTLAIACPKLDTNKESYIEKLTSMITESNINTLSVLMMQVPCCGGLIQMATMARQMSGKNIPIKKTIVGLQGEFLSEEWV